MQWQLPAVLAALSFIAALGALVAGWWVSETVTASCVETGATHARLVLLWIGIGVSGVLGVGAFGTQFVSLRPPTFVLYAVPVVLAVNVGICFLAVLGSEPCIQLTGK